MANRGEEVIYDAFSLSVLRRITVRGSIVGTRQDLEEALAFAGEGKVTTYFSWDKLSNINAVFDRMEHGGIDGRIVLGRYSRTPSPRRVSAAPSG
jgi:D-arabinose 1-dehydrogenase-like Zn-dependent alcohol dehydrogenase